jgi:putative transposase
VVLAIGGMPDHIHLVVKFPTTCSVAELMKQVKGVSSAFANDLNQRKIRFRWQEGYGVFSISRSHVKAVIQYVLNQKQHHAEGSVHADREETEEEFDSETGETL